MSTPLPQETTERPDGKPILHNSHVEMFFRCGMQFYYRYIEGLIKPPNSALLIGSATHDVAKDSLAYKINTQQAEMMPVEQVCDLARDSVVREYHKNGLRLRDQERGLDIRRVIDQCIDTTVALSVIHRSELVPAIEPVEVEAPWVIECESYPFDLAGQWDVNEPTGFRDLKTSNKRKSQADVDTSTQKTLYALAWKIIKGNYPEKIFFDVLIKTKTPTYQIIPTSSDDSDTSTFMRRFELMCDCIGKGLFLPCNQSDWWCNREWCGYAEQCPYFNKRVTVSMTTPEEEENDEQEGKVIRHAKRKRTAKQTISATDAQWGVAALL